MAARTENPAVVTLDCAYYPRMRALAIVLCTSWLHVAAAQSPSDIEQANALFLEGRDLLTSHQTKAACEKFEASIALDPTAPGVMLNLGLCHERLEHYATSLYWFRKAQVAAAEAKLPDYEDEAKRHTTTLANKVSIVKIAAPGDVEIRVDGKLIAATDYARVEIDRGGHTLEASAAGKQTYTKAFSVTSVDAGTLAVPALTDEPRVDRNVSNEANGPSIGRTVLAASFGVVGVGVCIASPIWASRIKRDYDTAMANGEMPSYSTARNKEHVATAMFVAGLGAIGFGTYLYLTAPSAHSPTVTSIAPVIGGNQLGVAITGSM